MGALPFAVQLLTALPGLIQAGMNVTTLIGDSTTKLKAMHDENRDPTPEEWSALNAQIKALRGELHAEDGPGS